MKKDNNWTCLDCAWNSSVNPNTTKCPDCGNHRIIGTHENEANVLVKTENITKIYKVAITAGYGTLYRKNIIEILCTETNVTFKWHGRSLNKSKIMRIDSMFKNDSPKSLAYFTYCFWDNIGEAHIMLYNHCVAKLSEFENMVLLLKKSLDL